MSAAAVTDARARANDEQRVASDPAVSAFVEASAGSGKTKLLTDRLLRLMLGGADPGRIQCLTFTKAAAAEMALRLQRRLGAWVTLPDDRLDAALRDLNVVPTAEGRDAARALFARVLDLPGGMRIGTIHAFCQSLLRRFPLEAQISPHFQLVDDIDAAVAMRESREDMLTGAHTETMRAALGTLAGLVSADQFGRLVGTLQADRDRLAKLLALDPDTLATAQRRAVGAAWADTEILDDAVRWDDGDVQRLAGAMRQQGAPGVVAKAGELLGWLGLPPEERTEHWGVWLDIWLTKDRKPRGMTVFVNKKLGESAPDLAALVLAEQARVEAVEDARRARLVAALSLALVTLAGPVAQGYDRRKDHAGWLDYDDLIRRSGRLLVDPGAAWVLFKLDGGLDHLLLDEVQDTSPAQWRIAASLTSEFFAGAGANEARRTIFAVGDPKQSIYGFQGADPQGFGFWRRTMEQRVRDAGAQWRNVTLDVSFRSTAPVLTLVDAVFADPEARQGVGAGLRHYPNRADQAGRVELWPLVPVPTAEDVEPWSVPERNQGSVSGPHRLADALADWIAAQTAGDVPLESRGRMLAPGDVLVLVRRRNDFTRSLVRALKGRGVPVAGLDRLVLTDQPAVADLLALCDALLLPQDDLTLAAVLTSPLGGLDDRDLMKLAPYRQRPLWDELRARAAECQTWQRAWDFLEALFRRVDYVTPHALLVEALGPLGARSRLFARLGPDASEPVDELLGAALAYARTHPPSLQGFVHWLRQSGAEVKREAEGAGGLVRIMTVHGAKGLQAPLVVLPDTTQIPSDDGQIHWTSDAALGVDIPIWSPRRELRCAVAAELREAEATARMEEHNRLLYVALTRAEDRLVVCGWDTRHKRAEHCWYNLVVRGFDRLVDLSRTPLAAIPQPWGGDVLSHASPQRAPVPRAAAASADRVAPLPGWAGAAPHWRADPAPDEPDLPTPLAPSRPGDAALGQIPAASSPLDGAAGGVDRFRRGQVAHALLQHLPELAPADRDAALDRYLARPGLGLADGDAALLAAEIRAVLVHPALTDLFGPEGRVEVPLTGVVAGQIVGGLVDRLAVFADRILVADYKTNRAPPATVDRVPVLYLRQMAAYRAVLAAAFPGRPVRCSLVWTTGVTVMPLPDSLLAGHAPGAVPAA